ncbi:helix-turn-helix domain-containing protein [[Clostridium] scindens]|uniref:helix-turn-helix domain-containing protein n=1 Tax=Clostridium scindens (strain JCM 10418 / VPI 12708) TaxID=29347 RepID=UPI0039939A99
MLADRKKLEIAMARACMNTEDLQKAANMPRPTLNNIITGRNIRPGTIGKAAKALQVDVTEILAEEKEDC